MKNDKVLGWAHKYRYDLFIIVVIIGLWVLFSELKGHFSFLSDRESFIALVKSFGVWGPVVIILATIAEVIIAPIPGAIPAFSSGFVFGVFWGSIYTYIGNVIGIMIVFFLARKWGRGVVSKLFKPERLKRYEQAIERRENYFLALFFVPVMPLDVLAAAFGLSKVNFKKFFVVILLGFAVYSIVMTMFGDQLAQVFF